MMKTSEIIDGLEDLIQDRKSFVTPANDKFYGKDNPFKYDIAVLKAAIDKLSRRAEPENKACPISQLEANEASITLLEIMEDGVADQQKALSIAFKALYWIANDRRAEPENKAQENPVVIQRAMQEIKEEHCGDYDCLLPEGKLDDSGYWANDDACKGCTYGVCYRALECLLHTTAPENKPLTIRELGEFAEADETVYEANGMQWDLYSGDNNQIRALHTAPGGKCDVVVDEYKIANGFFLYARKPEGSST